MKCSCNRTNKPGLLSLVFGLEFAPVECGGEGKEIPSGLPCPCCNSRPYVRLRKHGRYMRLFESVGGSKIPIWIQRLYCPVCDKTHACLFPCLVPGSSYSADSLGELVAPYILEDKSYEELGWSVSPDEGSGHRHLIYGIVERLCERLDWVTGFVAKQVLKRGDSLWKRNEPEPLEELGSTKRVRAKDKREMLTRLKAVLMKFKRAGEYETQELISKLHQASMQARAPFSLLTRPRAALVSAPHQRGNALF